MPATAPPTSRLFKNSGHSFVQYRLAVLTVMLLIFVLPASASEVHRWQGAWPESGRVEQVVDLPATDMYSFQVRAEQPVIIELVDRVTGPAEGVVDRLDRLAMAGPIKVVLRARGAATGQVELLVHRFDEQHDGNWPVLADERLIRSTLADKQQRSWWLELEQAEHISLEAAGRHLGALRLWRDGVWLEDVAVEATVFNADSDRPLAGQQLHAYLPAGRYRLVAYAGPGVSWAQDSTERPLYLRRGIPAMPAMGWWRYRASPFGIDRWRLDSTANRIELRLPEAATASLSLETLESDRNPYQRVGGRGQQRISKESRRPWVMLADEPYRGRSRLVTIERSPGEPYRLSALSHGEQYALREYDDQRLYLGVAGMSDPRDTIAPTMIAYDSSDWRRGERTPLAEQLPVVSPQQGWAGRFNLLREVAMLVRISEAGDYRVELSPDSEALAAMRLQPLMAAPTEGLETRWQFGSEQQWMLEPGLYQLSLRPESGLTGIAELRMHAVDSAMPAIDGDETVGLGDLPPVRAARDRYARVNDFDHGQGGLVIRPLPLQLAMPLPVMQSGESVRRFEFGAGQDRTLVATSEDGQALPLALNADGPWQQELRLPGKGERSVWVRNPGQHAVAYNLHYRGEAPSPLSQQPASDGQARLPALPVGEPLPVKLAKQQAISHGFQVDAPGLYRIESEGLLDTRASLRDRVRLDLASARDGGSGRNFLIQHYLGEGEYRLVSQALGESAGLASLMLGRAGITDGGYLPPGSIGRATVAAGQALVYRLPIKQAGRYRIHSRGLASDFALVLEGPDGWPLIRPGSRSPETVELAVGEHRLLILPQALDARAVTTVERLNQPEPEFDGHGPHTVDLNSGVHHQWRESDTRQPDIWRFSLPDAMHVGWSLTDSMDAQLQYRDEGQWRDITDSGQPAYREAGEYRLLLRAVRVDDRRDYSLRVHTRELPPGQQRGVRLPADVALVLDEPSLVQLSTLSPINLEATLVDSDGQRVAFSDQRANDWNPMISGVFEAGHYTLRLRALEDEHAEVQLFHQRPRLASAGALRLGDSIDLAGQGGRIYPIELPDTDPQAALPVVFDSHSTGSHGVALERQHNGRWERLDASTGAANRGGWVLPAGGERAAMRLRVWPLDDQPHPIHLTLHGPDSTGALGRNRLHRIDGVEATLHRLTDAAAGDWLWATAGQSFQATQASWLAPSGGALWLLGPAEASPPTLQSLRVSDGIDQRLPLWPQATVEIVGGQQGLRLWRLDGALSLAGLSPVNANAGTGWAVDGERSAVAIALPGVAASQLKMSATSARGEARLRALSVDVSQAGALDAGHARSIQLPAGQAQVLALATPHHLDLVLPAEVALARQSTGGDITAVFWAGDKPRTVSLQASAGRLWLINAGAAATETRLMSSAQMDHSGAPWLMTQAQGSTGIRQLRLPDEPVSLHLAGDLQRVLWLRPDGGVEMVSSGTHAVEAGRLLFSHGSGAFALWVDGPSGQPLEQWAHQDQALLLQAQQPGAWEWRLADGATRWLWQRPEAPRVVLPDASTPVALRFHAVDGGDGAARVVRQPYQSMTEGQGRWRTVVPGEAQLLAFELAEHERIGLGLETDNARLQASLLNAAGEPLAQGIVQFHPELAPGRYLWRIELPADAEPARFRATLLGTDTPDDLIPDAVRQRLKEAQP